MTNEASASGGTAPDTAASGRSSTGVQSVEIGNQLLRALASAKGPMPLTAIAAAVGMSPGHTHKYLSSLIRCELVVQAEPGAPYDLGPFAIEMGLAALRRLDIYTAVGPYLDTLRNRLGVTSSMAIWANRGVTIVKWAETPDVFAATVRIGTVVPLLTSAFGRIFAAFMDRSRTEPLIRAELSVPDGLAARAGLRTMEDVDRLLAEFRRQRMAVAENLVDPGRTVLTAPVFNHEGEMKAALAVVGDYGHFDTRWNGRPARELAAAATEFSRRLGAPCDP